VQFPELTDQFDGEDLAVGELGARASGARLLEVEGL
jgi:hypothetical protein